MLLRLHWARPLVFILLIAFAASLSADTAYYQRVFFDNSTTPDSYFYSRGEASIPSTLKLVGKRVPVDSENFYTGPNALRLEWNSQAKGFWSAELRLYEFRNRVLYFPGDALSFWMYSPQALAAADLPRLVLKDSNKNFTQPLELGAFAKDLPANRWVQVQIPMQRFETASLSKFEPHLLNRILFVQGANDSRNHVLLVDQIKVDSFTNHESGPATVRHLRATGYERHIDLSWDESAPLQVDYYNVYRATGGGGYQKIGMQVPGIHRYADYLGKPGQQVSYKITAVDRSAHESQPSETVTAATRAMSDDELLTMVQEASFRYYWEGAAPNSGMTRENIPGNDPILALGASGFGVMAIIVGVERGFITREQAIDRLLQITTFLARADRFHGAWPHFLDDNTGHPLPVFGVFENGADLVETSFLVEGLLSARGYFNASSARETQLHDRITQLWQGVEWDWFRRFPNGDALYWHWSPEYAFVINNRLTGFNEVMITYLEAIASPTHGVPLSLYYSGWVGEGINNPYSNGQTYYSIKLAVGFKQGSPLFFTHYSYMGFNPHDFRDRFTNYFENNRNMALINQRYCMANPGGYKGYSADDWGITAVDGPQGYVDYAPTPKLDDGTIAPTGSVSSIVYTPEASLAALKHFYRDLGSQLWGVYGFMDAFNQSQDWVSGIYMGLNQAPMAVMIENYRSGVIWKAFMSNPEIQTMMEKLESESR